MVWMVYITHYPNILAYVFPLLLYYISIPAAFIVWWMRYSDDIMAGARHLKSLGVYFLIALVTTSSMLFLLTDEYLYVHADGRTPLCLSGSCITSQTWIGHYRINTADLKRFGIPEYGMMREYRLVDSGVKPNSIIGEKTKVNSLVIIRTFLILPVTEVYDYKIGSDMHTVVSKEKFYIVFPEYPGTVLTEHYDMEFSLFLWHM
ncbi:hypothetical protein [Thermococcus sp.]|uniref:hypothetical protein n=1 Tax=Thermococcus sp. TaxID=35749 RepID=UPI00261D4EBE|nr:hypothetical protein [Thermococcus sp.]